MKSNLALVALILPLAFANPLEIVESTEALPKSIEDNLEEEIAAQNAQFNFGYSIQVLLSNQCFQLRKLQCCKFLCEINFSKLKSSRIAIFIILTL